MKQTDLNRAVARATGETVCTIQRLGFLLADPDVDIDPHCDDSGPYVIDWDELELQRNAAEVGRPHDEPAAA